MDKVPGDYKYLIAIRGDNAIEVAYKASQMLIGATWVSSKAGFLVKKLDLRVIELAIQLAGGQSGNYTLVEIPGRIQRQLYKLLDDLPDSSKRWLNQLSENYDAILLRSIFLFFLVAVPMGLSLIGFKLIGITPSIKNEITFRVNALAILFVTFLTIYTWVIIWCGFLQIIIIEYFYYSSKTAKHCSFFSFEVKKK